MSSKRKSSDLQTGTDPKKVKWHGVESLGDKMGKITLASGPTHLGRFRISTRTKAKSIDPQHVHALVNMMLKDGFVGSFLVAIESKEVCVSVCVCVCVSE